MGFRLVKLLIDTCNVLHRTGILPPELAGIDERSLVRLLQKSRYQDLSADFMCDGPRIGSDGQPRADTKESCHFHFAGRNQSADTLIITAVQASSSPRSLLVVSSDRRIQIEAKKRRCRVISADDFLEQLSQDAALGQRTTRSVKADDLPRSTEYWLKEFGVDHAPEPSDQKQPEHIESRKRPDPIKPPPPPPPSPTPPSAESRAIEPTDSPSDQARWQQLMAEADRLWKAHKEAEDYPA